MRLCYVSLSCVLPVCVSTQPKCVDANTKADEPSAGTTNDATKQCAHRAAKPLDGNVTWKLDKDKDRVLTISEFKGKTYVNIRDYYEKGGKLLPGKGISLTVDQWRVLGECVADVDAVLAVNK